MIINTPGMQDGNVAKYFTFSVACGTNLNIANQKKEE